MNCAPTFEREMLKPISRGAIHRARRRPEPALGTACRAPTFAGSQQMDRAEHAVPNGDPRSALRAGGPRHSVRPKRECIYEMDY